MIEIMKNYINISKEDLNKLIRMARVHFADNLDDLKKRVEKSIEFYSSKIPELEADLKFLKNLKFL